MPQWQIATALGIAFLVGLSTHVFYRRPPASLWPSLPAVFFAALIFSVGDLLANVWAENDKIRWVGMILVYTGLLTIAPSWWLFSRRFSEMVGYRKVAFRHGLSFLVAINSVLWIGLLTNPLHGLFLETNAGARSEYGPLWYATAIINYVALSSTMVVHAQGARYVNDPTIRSQSFVLVTAVGIPMALNMVYVFSPTPLPYDPTALGFALSCALFLFAVERRDLFVLERVSLPSVLDHDADPIIIVSRHNQLLYANPKAQTLFGEGKLVPGAPIGELLARVVPSFSLSDLSEGLSNDTLEHRFLGPDGSERWVVFELSRIQRTRALVAGVSLRIRDQTALHDAEMESESHFAMLEAVGLAAGEGILVKEDSGETRYVNEAFASLWGSTPNEMIELGHALQSNLGTQLSESPPMSMQRLWHGVGEPFDSSRRETCDLRTRDGRTLEVESLPVETVTGFRGRAWRMRDVTRARRESRAVIQAQKTEGLALMAGGIAHDYNNLLMSILGSTEIVREEIDAGSPLQATLADVEQAAITAADLTSQLLDYAGKSSFERENLDLSSLVRDVTSLLSVNIPKNIKVILDLPEGLPPVRGGSAQLRQVLMNFVTNASEAIEDRAGSIEVRTGTSTTPIKYFGGAVVEHGDFTGDAVHLSVQDDGMGMDAATLSKIFDPFFTTKFTGRGLGLAATLGIVTSHGGKLRIESQIGRGSRFTLILPVLDDAKIAGGATAGKTNDRRFANRRVLIVDDEPIVRTILAKHLGAFGLEVHVAEGGSEGLALLDEAELEIDLVILDITMPGLSGISTRELIRERDPALPILLASGHPEDALSRLENWNRAIDGFIQKPFRKKQLLSKVERFLDNDSLPEKPKTS